MKRRDFEPKNILISKTAPKVLSDCTPDEIKKLEELRLLCDRFKSGSGHTKKELRAALLNSDYSLSTFYRRRHKYEQSGVLSDLTKPCKKITRARRTSDEVEAIIQTEIKRLQIDGITSISDIHSSVVGAIYGENLIRGSNPKLIEPSLTTIRNRVLAIPTHQATVRALGRRRAEKFLGPLPGETPKQEYALSRVQIDHTLVDVYVICSQTGLALRRPWITLAIDEFSRAIVGVLISFEAPSGTKLARFMVNMIYPKDDLLAEMGVDFDWPMYGKPKIIYTDNGSDLRGNSFRLGNLELNILHEFRPVGEAHYGGQIERLVGTAMKKVNLLPGRTKSEWAKEMQKFDPSKTATMTMERLERWIIQWITGDYHCQQREELDWMTPLDKWKSAFAVGANNPSPPRIYPPNRHKTYCSYLPIGRRTLQRGHFQIFALKYWDEALEPFVRLDTAKKFEIRFDANDVSFIYFRNPNTGEFIRIGCKDRNFPSMPLSQWKLTRKLARQAGRNPDCVESRKRAAYLMRKETMESKTEAKQLQKAYIAERKLVNDRVSARSSVSIHAFATPDGSRPERKKRYLPKREPIVDKAPSND